MKMDNLLEEINEICKNCKKCDPCCTGNLIKKNFNNQKFESRAA